MGHFQCCRTTVIPAQPASGPRRLVAVPRRRRRRRRLRALEHLQPALVGLREQPVRLVQHEPAQRSPVDLRRDPAAARAWGVLECPRARPWVAVQKNVVKRPWVLRSFVIFNFVDTSSTKARSAICDATVFGEYSGVLRVLRKCAVGVLRNAVSSRTAPSRLLLGTPSRSFSGPCGQLR